MKEDGINEMPAKSGPRILSSSKIQHESKEEEEERKRENKTKTNKERAKSKNNVQNTTVGSPELQKQRNATMNAYTLVYKS